MEIQIDRKDFDDNIGSLHKHCIHHSISANRKAKFYRAISIIFSTIILSSGIIIGSISQFNTSSSKNVITSLAVIFSAVQFFIVIFSPEKKAGLLKRIAQNLEKIAREVKRLKSSKLSEEQLYELLELYYSQINILDLALFDIIMEHDINKFFSKTSQ